AGRAGGVLPGRSLAGHGRERGRVCPQGRPGDRRRAPQAPRVRAQRREAHEPRRGRRQRGARPEVPHSQGRPQAATWQLQPARPADEPAAGRVRPVGIPAAAVRLADPGDRGGPVLMTPDWADPTATPALELTFDQPQDWINANKRYHWAKRAELTRYWRNMAALM